MSIANLVNEFTLSLVRGMADKQTNAAENLLVSPYNILHCVSAIGLGATKGASEDNTRDILFGSAAGSFKGRVSEFMSLDAEIKDASKDAVTLTTAASVWVNALSASLNPTYDASVRDIMNAQVTSLPFTNPDAPNAINGWVKKETNGLITSIFDRVSREALVAVVSALYFKGDWTHPFEKRQTKDRPFTADDGKVYMTPTMSRFQEHEMGYMTGPGYEAASITYGEKVFDQKATKWKNPTTRLVLVKPSTPELSAREILVGGHTGWLDGANFSNRYEGRLEIPHMDMECTYSNMITPLADMGLTGIFARGGVNRMTQTGDASVTDLIHKTVFKSDEKGSEAAAVTGGMVRATSVRPATPRVDFKADRPCIMALQDIKTGTLLFVGLMNTPNKKMVLVP